MTGLERPLGSLKVEAVTISKQLKYDGGKVVSLTHRPLYPEEIYPVLISVSLSRLQDPSVA
jgi:hypothetical protein